MKIKIKNLGVIKKAEFDLSKSLIIFTGANNTGKTFISYFLFGLFYLKKNKELLTEFNLDKYKIQEQGKNIKSDDDYTTDMYNISEYLQKDINQTVKEIKNEFKKLYKSIFPTSIHVNPLVDIEYNESEINDFLNTGTIYGDGEIFANLNNGFFSIKYPQENNFYFLAEQHFDLYLKDFLFNKVTLPYFFPAERETISLFYKNIIRDKARNSDAILSGTTEYNPSLKSAEGVIPLCINEYIFFVDRFSEIVRRGESPYKNIAEELEKLIGGKIVFGHFQEMLFNPTGTSAKIEMSVSSSTVKSMAGLVIYFNYVAKEGDVIFIDEPELNLHPDNQRKIARILAKASNTGIKVILSTHSDYIIKEFNNLIMLSGKIKNKDKFLKSLLYNKNEILQKENVSVYLFEDKTAKQVDFDKYGMISTTFDNTVDEINTASELIGLEIKKY